MARKDNMARTKKHVPEFSKPATRPCDAYALRYPLPYCESADDSSDATESFDEQRYLEANTNKLLEELMQSGVDTLETKADYSSDATESFDEQRYLEANKFREELIHSGVDTSTTWVESQKNLEGMAKWKLEDDARLLRNDAEMMAWNSPDNVHPNVHPNVQKRRPVHPNVQKRRPTSPNNVHPNVQMCRAIRKRKQQVTEAVDAEIQVQARSGVDLYTQMAKKMRLRRRSNEK
jgi:hypothetical protein